MRGAVVLALLVVLVYGLLAIRWARAEGGAADLSLSIQSPPTRLDVNHPVSYLFQVSNPGPESLRNVALVVTWPASLRPVGPTQGGVFECLNLTAGTGDGYHYLTLCKSGYMPPGRAYILQQMMVTNLARDYVEVHASVLSASSEAYWPNNNLDLSTKVGD